MWEKKAYFFHAQVQDNNGDDNAQQTQPVGKCLAPLALKNTLQVFFLNEKYPGNA